MELPEIDPELIASLIAPVPKPAQEPARPQARSLGWFWVAAHLVDEDAGTTEELPLDSRTQMRALIASPDGWQDRWPYSRIRNRPWDDEPGFRDALICGIAETDELIVELSDHQYSWMVARSGEHMPEYRHFPVAYVRESLPQPTICLADEILSREQAYSIAFNWLRYG